jgi:nitronate monooxygenase
VLFAKRANIFLMDTTSVCTLLGIEYPIIMAPMFLVSNTKMVIEALEAGITGVLPALNYRHECDFKAAINEIRQKTSKPFGVNIIANQTNLHFDWQLKTVIEERIDFVITSLGNPMEVIEKCHLNGIKVFCDVVDLKHAQKVEQLGADGLIAVNNWAGGHAGILSANDLIPLLKKNCSIPVISAGGVANHQQYIDMLNLGADGVSVGTPFIASVESDVSDEYKNAIVNYGSKDIVKTNKMSGTPLHVINTPYVQSIGLKANIFEWVINKNFKLKNISKAILFSKGMNTLRKSAFKADYKTVWVAGHSIEGVKQIKPVKEIVRFLVSSES